MSNVMRNVISASAWQRSVEKWFHNEYYDVSPRMNSERGIIDARDTVWYWEVPLYLFERVTIEWDMLTHTRISICWILWSFDWVDGCATTWHWVRSRKFFVVTQCGHSIVRRKSKTSGNEIHTFLRLDDSMKEVHSQLYNWEVWMCWMQV